MSLNIKQPRAHEIAAQLAKLTGESLTTAVVRSLEERLEREEQKRSKGAKTERVREFLKRYTHRIPEEMKNFDYDAWLYDEYGLPK